MKFCWTTINVMNMADSLKFYQEIVGLKLKRRFSAGPGTEISFLGNDDTPDGTEVELIRNEAKDAVIFGPDISLGFEVSDLEEKIRLVQDKGLSIQGPFQPNPSVKFFFVNDPNGLSIQFVQNINSVKL